MKKYLFGKRLICLIQSIILFVSLPVYSKTAQTTHWTEVNLHFIEFTGWWNKLKSFEELNSKLQISYEQKKQVTRALKARHLLAVRPPQVNYNPLNHCFTFYTSMGEVKFFITQLKPLTIYTENQFFSLRPQANDLIELLGLAESERSQHKQSLLFKLFDLFLPGAYAQQSIPPEVEQRITDEVAKRAAEEGEATRKAIQEEANRTRENLNAEAKRIEADTKVSIDKARKDATTKAEKTITNKFLMAMGVLGIVFGGILAYNNWGTIKGWFSSDPAKSQDTSSDANQNKMAAGTLKSSEKATALIADLSVKEKVIGVNAKATFDCAPNKNPHYFTLESEGTRYLYGYKSESDKFKQLTWQNENNRSCSLKESQVSLASECSLSNQNLLPSSSAIAQLWNSIKSCCANESCPEARRLQGITVPDSGLRLSTTSAN